MLIFLIEDLTDILEIQTECGLSSWSENSYNKSNGSDNIKERIWVIQLNESRTKQIRKSHLKNNRKKQT